ncbi:tenascin-X isoform X3 [Ambystoma mexicanum]|uniref:tenascin-X isoform X3 n=1 Tax=Ambystoma mexicanum TaxID=8296 RepID=UPI0037E98C4D
MVNPAMAFALVLAALPLGPSTAGLFTKRFRLRRETGANATVFSHVYNIRMPRCESCAADVAEPTTALQEARGETTQQQMYEHTLEGEKQMVFTHRINIPPQACGCPSTDTLQALLSRLEALESQVAAFRDQCPGGSCCAATQAGNGQTDIQGLCSRHGTFDFSKCHCVCEKGWSGPTCAESSCPDNCSGHGRCVDGECICRKGFTGESCELTACPDDCNDQGRCVEGKCVCFPGYRGPTCGEPSCPGNCQGHGKCVKDTCICDPGFTGPDCGARACPENCKDQGKCIDGTCHCDAGFAGPDCSMRSCPENCSNRGTCIEGKCICNPGYAGTDCGSRSCPENCKNRGQCINGKCVCNPGFTGPACGARSCPENCQNHGQCINGKCVCNPGYSGPSCGSRTCPDNCSGRGTCEDGRCACSEGYTGPNCGIRTCPENCLGRGQCENGRCVCGDGFTGPNCGTKTCPDNCKNRGRCEDGRCVCEEGFTGYNCGTKTCPDNCRNKGRCEDGKCVCEEGFTGPNCGTKTCPENCRNKGLCEDGKCVCEEGFTGPNCGTRTCPDNCKNQGLCEDGKCVCHEGFTGPNCGAKTCLDNCNSHGQCVDGQCVCQAGYGGINCRTRTCPNNCNNRGRCENGKCVCEEGYVGPICGLKVCLNNCNNRGRCQKGTCVCRRGYTGPDCGEETCPGQCQGRGLCVNGRCQCQAGFTGLDCSERMCPKACSQHGRCEDGKCVCHDGFTGDDCSTAVPAVEGLRVRAREETSVTVEWQRPQTPVDGFEISFRPTKEDDGVLSSRLRSTATAFNQSGLAPGEEYLVTIRTQKDQTLGPETTMTITTRIDGPKHVRVTEVTQTSLTLHWDRPAAHVDRYLVTYVSAAGIPRQVVVPASGEEVVTLTDLDSGAEYTLTVTAERGSEASVPASTVATTAAAYGARKPGRESLPAGAVEEMFAGRSGMVKKLVVPSPTPKVRGTAQIGVGSSSERLQFTDGQRVVTTVIDGRESQKVVIPNMRPAISEEEIRTRKVVSGGEHQKIAIGKTQPTVAKEKKVVTTDGATQEPPKSSSGNVRPVILKKGKVITTVITRGPSTAVPTNEKSLLSKKERLNTTIITGGKHPHLATSSGRPSISTMERFVKKVLTGEGAIQVVPTGKGPTLMKEKKVVTTVITRQGHKKDTLTTEERVITTDLVQPEMPKVAPSKKPSATREESVIRGKVVSTDGRPQLTEDGKVISVIGGKQSSKGAPPTKSPPPIIKKEHAVTSVMAKEGVRKGVLTDAGPSVTRDGKTVLTGAGKEVPPTKRLLLGLPTVSPGAESSQLAPVDKRPPHMKEVRVIAIDVEASPTKTSLVPKKGKVVLTTFTKELAKPTKSTDKKTTLTAETEAAVAPGKQPPKVASQDKRPLLSTKDSVSGILISGEDSQKAISSEKRPTHTRVEKVVSTLDKKHSYQLVPVDGKPPVSKEKTAITGVKKLDAGHKPVPSTKSPGTTKESMVIFPKTREELDRVSSSEGKPIPTKKSVVPTAVSKVGEKKVIVAEKRPTFSKEDGTIMKAVTEGERQKVLPHGKKVFSGEEDRMVGKSTKPVKKDPTGEHTSRIKTGRERSNQTTPGDSQIKLLMKNDLLLKNVIQNISAKLSPFNGTLLQRLESYLKATSYPMRENQTIKTVAKAIFLYLVSKKPPNIREIVYDRLAEKTPTVVTTLLLQPTPPSERVTYQGSRGIPFRLPEGDSVSDDDRKPDSARTPVQRRHESGGQNLSQSMGETRKKTDALRGGELRPTSASQKEGYSAREALQVEQKASNGTITENMKHPRPQVVSRLSTSILVSLDGLKGHSNTIVINYRDVHADLRGHRLVLPGNTSIAKISGLSPGTKYRVDLHGVFKGQSSKSYSIVTSTAPDPGPTSSASDEPPTPQTGAPTTQPPRGDSAAEPHSASTEAHLGDLSVTGIASDRITLSWRADPGVFDHFSISYNGSAAPVPTEVLVPGDQRTTELSALQPGAEYEIQLRGVSEGVHTLPVMTKAKTAARKPHETPTLLGGLAVTSIAEDGFGLGWKARKGVFDSFLVRYEDVGGRLGSQETSVPGDQRATAIRDLDAGTEYTISLYGVRKGQLSRALKTTVTTASAEGDGMLARVEDLTASDILEDSVMLSWTVQDGDFDFFLIQYRDVDDQTQELTIRGDQTSVIIPGLLPATMYTFTLFGVSDDKQSRPSTVNVTTALVTPTLGDLLAADVTHDSLRLSWVVQDGEFDSFLLQYNDSQGQSKTLPVDAGLHSTTVSGLQPAETYTFELYGVSNNTQSEPVSLVAKTASPEKSSLLISNLSSSDITSDSLRLSWTTEEGVFDSFLIQYQDAEGNPQELPIDGDLSSVTISGLRPSKIYKFLLYGVSGDRRGKPLSMDVTTAAAKKALVPARLGQLSVSDITSDSLQLSWNVPSGDFDSFLILYRDAQGNPQELAVPGDLRIATISDLKLSKKYKFLLHGISGAKRSKAVSTEATTAAAKKALVPARLGQLSVSDITSDSLQLSWNVPSGDFDSFLILYRDAQGNPQELPVPGDLRIATISDLKPSKKYKFLLHGISGAKRSKAVSTEATTASAPKKAVGRLPKLGDLSVSEVQKDSLTLSWTVPEGEFDSFLILYKDSEGAPRELAVDGHLRATFITGLKPSQKYKFALYGVSEKRRAQPVSAEAITAAREDMPTPSPKLGELTVSDVTKDSLRLSWSDQGRAYDTFLILYRDAEGRPRGLPLSGDHRTTVVTGLVPSTKYTFLLYGVNGRNRSIPISADATTETAVSPLPMLTDLSISKVTEDSLRLSWTTRGGDFDSFLIQYRDAEGNPQERVVDGDQQETTISGLVPSEKYTFYLQGIVGEARVGPLSSDVITASPVKASSQLPELGDLSASDVTEKSVRLSWTSHSGHFDSFLIQYRDTDGRLQELPVDGDREDASISNLEPSKKYTIVLYGISEGMRTQPRSTEFTTTAETAVSPLPMLTDLSISKVTEDSLRLSWTTQGRDFDSFLIQYRDAEGNPQERVVDGGQQETTISGLVPSEKYTFYLQGIVGEARVGPLSSDVITASPAKASSQLPELGDLSASDVTGKSVRLSWTSHSGHFDSFLIQYKDTDGRLQELPVDGDREDATISNLEPSKKYTIVLYGISEGMRTQPRSTEFTTTAASPAKASSQLPELGDLSASDVTEKSVRLSWTSHSGHFDSFLIQYRDTDGRLQELPVDGDREDATISSLEPSKKYTVVLYGISEGMRTQPRSTEFTTTAASAKPVTRPARLGELSASDITRDSLRLSWSLQDGDFDSYLIQYRDAAGRVQELPVDRDHRSATISGLRPSKKYKFILYGLSGERRSKSIFTEATTATLEKATTQPPKLGDLSVSDITKDSLQLSWDVEEGVFGSFLIQYRDADGTPRELTVDGDFRTARIVGLKPAKKYKFSLYGISGDRRTKAVSAEATTAPPEKAISLSPKLGEFFVSDITKDSLQLTWTIEDGDFDSFVIQYRDADGQIQELVIEGDHHTTTVAGLLPSRKYKFNLYGISRNRRTKAVSTEATTAFPEAVGQQAAMLDDLYLSDVGPHSVQLSWDASEGAFDSFLVQYVDSQGLAPSREMLLVGDARTAPIGGLQPSTEYTFTLSGLQRGQKRADLNTVGRTSRLELEAPRDLEFRNIQETSLVVSWSPPYMAVDNFKVSYQLADGGEPQSISVDGKSTKVPLKGLTPGARYEVNVMSIRGFEESEPLTGYVTTVPDGPTDLRAVNVTETSALLLWRPALAVVDTYIVTYSAQNVPTVTKTLSGNTAALHLDGLKVDTEYTAKIQSAKGSNRSSPATTTFTTSADAPRDLTASRVTPRSAVLSWTPPQAVPTGYILTYEAPSGEIKEIQLGASANTYQLSELIPLSQYRARVQAVRGRAITAPTSTVFTTARLRYPFPRDCAEERLNGVSRSQVVTIYLDGERNRPIKVFCDMETDGGGWIVFQRRMNGKTNFWRNWQDYALGFGNLTQEFWLGNENLHKITSQGVYELRVDLRTKNESAYAIYDSFRVDTQASYYRLRLGKYSGTAGDSLSYHNNMIFSTRDRDRNKHIMPCAISYRGAWWYKNCHYVNLNGLYGNNKDHQGVNWYDWKGFEFSIPFTEMKMRPKNSLALRRI